MAKSYLITIHSDKVTGTQVMKVLQKLGCFVEMKDLPNDNAAQHSVNPTGGTRLFSMMSGAELEEISPGVFREKPASG